MKNTKNIAQGFLLTFLLLGATVAIPAYATNGIDSSKDFLDVHASIKADALIKLESSSGAVVGPNGAVRVTGAKVTSVSNSDINASVPFGNSSLNFVVKGDANTKLNGKNLGTLYATTIANLKAGDKISFAGTITSSTSSSIVVDGDQVVSRALFSDLTDKTSFKGEVKAVNTSDNSFTLDLKNGRTVKVNVSSTTAITLDGTVKTLSSLQEGDEVNVTGALSADASVVTASKVTVSSDDNNHDHDKDTAKKDDNGKKENKGWFGRLFSWFR